VEFAVTIVKMEKKRIIIWSIIILLIIIIIIGTYFLFFNKPKKIRPPVFVNATDENWCKKGNNVMGFNSSYFNHPINFRVINITNVSNIPYCEIKTMDQKSYYISMDQKEVINKTKGS